MWSSRSMCRLALLIVVVSLLNTARCDTQDPPLMTAWVSDGLPWLHIGGNSDQVQPLYLGLSPRQIELDLGNSTLSYIDVPDFLQPLGEKQLHALDAMIPSIKSLPIALIEGWPAYDQTTGEYTWSWARFRGPSDAQWTFISSSLDDQGNLSTGFLPKLYRPWIGSENNVIFQDFLQLNSLYDKPVFGDCIWVSEDGRDIYGAWFPPSAIEIVKSRIISKNAKAPIGQRYQCLTLPQPCRYDGKPASFMVQLSQGQIRWPSALRWSKPTAYNFNIPPLKPLLPFPETFADDLARDVKILDGESEAVFPISKRVMNFTRKNNADSTNQLEDMVDYFEERYQVLGVQTSRAQFKWRNITHSNLVAIFSGRVPSLKPVILADHFDTAFSEDTFAKTGKRVSNPGCDDNAFSTAVLLNAAALLAKLDLQSEVWLVHITGEEFPADGLGTRAFISSLLKEQLDFRVMIFMDMIAYQARMDKTFQINPGQTYASQFAAQVAYASAVSLNSSLIYPVMRSRFDKFSYLFNTDAIICDQVGYPTVLINEHINYNENFDRPYYHQSTDLFNTIDVDYGAAVAKVAVETLAQLSNWDYNTMPKEQ